MEYFLLDACKAGELNQFPCPTHTEAGKGIDSVRLSYTHQVENTPLSLH